MLRIALLLLSYLTFSAPVQAQVQEQEYQSFIDHSVRVCDEDARANTLPDFEKPDCRSAMFFQVDPQNRMLWVEIVFEAEPELLESDKPLGLFLSAKASSEVFLNGVAIGTNGTPGASQTSEVPGDMDAVFFIPEGTLLASENHLAVRLSSMNGDLTLNSPIHNIVLAPYRDPRQPGPATWFALVTLGLFVAGFVFFGVSSLRGKDRQSSALIAAISLTAALQLGAESARDIMPYPYPLHDLRLSLILAFGISLALSLVAYALFALFRPYPKRRTLSLAALLVIMLFISAVQPGFDLKTGYVFVAASLAAGLAGMIAHLQGNRTGGLLALAGLALAGAILWLGGLFLDTVLYLIVAATLLWLFFKHARAGDLGDSLVLDAEAPRRVEMTSNGKVEFVDANDIVRFSGAGDYVEVFLSNGRSALHNVSLAALERDLSHGFIRVHRSHIVNASCVQSLTRQSAGTGELQMSNGAIVPVSRRNMASVRKALKYT